MSGVMVSIFTILSYYMRGKCSVRTCATDREYKHKFRYTASGEIRSIVLICREYKHSVVYDRWFIKNLTRYSYAVEMIRVDNDAFSDYHIGHYPLLCSKRHIKSLHPHRCAVNVHLDHIFD